MFKNDQRHGKGTMIEADGTTYSGSFVDDAPGGERVLS